MKLTIKIRAKYIIKEYKNLIKENSKILDIGSGNGCFSKIMQKETNSSLIGIDIIDYNKENINFRTYGGERLPFKENTFDIATLSEVLHHSTNQEQLLKEALRVSKRVLISDTDISSRKLITYILDIGLNFIHSPLVKTPLNFKTKKEFMKMFSELNLDVIEVRDVKTPYIYPFKHLIFEIKKKEIE